VLRHRLYRVSVQAHGAPCLLFFFPGWLDKPQALRRRYIPLGGLYMSKSKADMGAGNTEHLSGKDAGLTKDEARWITKNLNELDPFGAQFKFQVFPQPVYLDRTKPDRDRFMDRVRPRITKDHIKELLRRGGDILKGVYISGMSGMSSTHQYVPLTGSDFQLPIAMASLPIGVGEPRWRPGRDRGGSGGGGPDASDDPSDLVFLDLSWEDLAELLSLLFDLPWLLAKDADKILAYKLRVRGIKKTGPQARLDETETYQARLERYRTLFNARPEEFEAKGLSIDSIPTVEEFPYDDDDQRFKRVEERWDPDSKAVVFFEFDTSGSMGGEPMAIARFFFLLNLIWLRARYGEVDVVLVPHNAIAFRVQSEQEFFTIDAGGGTMFSPAHELCMEIAAREYPASIYNRYAFHATDGYNFEPPAFLAEVIERMVTPGQGDFNYFGYLEIDPYGWGGRSATWGWAAIDLLSEAARRHVGASKVSNQDQVPEAMKEILSKDPAAGEGS
jgi:uncharacterized sporulation protein YeaH/YhbH (DUF444 family)